MNIISPLTLLVVPLIGSLIILSYPYMSYKYSERFAVNLERPLKQAKSLIVPVLKNEKELYFIEEQKAEKENFLIKELVEKPLLEKQNSNLKKIAIITSLINFVISIFL